MRQIVLSVFCCLPAILYAQGICDSTITIAPIQPICSGTEIAYVQVSHPGGVFDGPGFLYNNNYLYAENLNAGFYSFNYTITGPGGCTVQASQTFEVLPAHSLSAWVQGKINCSDPASTAQLNVALTTGPNGVNYDSPTWEGPEGITLYSQIATTHYAGRYKVTAYPVNAQVCPAFGFAEVKFENNPLDINIVSCTNCQGVGGIRVSVDTFPAGWPNPRFSLPHGFISNNPNCVELHATGTLTATLINPANGCISTDVVHITSLANPRPSVNAGSDYAITCGTVNYLVGALSPGGGMLDFEWLTQNGQFAGPTNTMNPAIDRPGTYVLRGYNTFTGCSATDTVVVGSQPSYQPQISVICDGESVNGYDQTGNYTDTVVTAAGCLEIKFLKLIVLAPLEGVFEVQADDNGQSNGSAEFVVTQGWGPFSYYWDTGETTPIITGLSAGTYTLTITDSNGCAHVQTVEVPAGKPLPPKRIAQRSDALDGEPRLFPNLVSSGLVQTALKVMALEAEEADFWVQDAMGRPFARRTVEVLPGENTFALAENLPAGFYTVCLRGNGGLSVVAKLVVR